MKATDYCKNVFDGTHDTPKPAVEGYKLLTSKNILDGRLDKEDAYYISAEDYDAVNLRSRVRQWDVLFSMIGTVGNVCLVTDENIDFAIKNMGDFSCEDEEHAKWLYYYLQSPYAKKLMENYLNGAVQKFLPLGWMRELDIPEYDRNKKSIVDFLWDIDSKISNNSSICSDLESMAKLLYDYWFVQFDFPDENGKPYKSSGGKMVWNEELKREIPEGWEVRRIGDMITTERGISYSTPNIATGRGVPMLNLATFKPGGGDYKADGLKHYLGEYPTNKVLDPYELIMCNTQQTAIKFETDIIGRAMLVPDIFEGDVVFSHHVNVIRTQNEALKYYLLFLFNSDYYHKYISGFTNGTNILGLSFNGVEDYITEIPSDEILEKFGKLILETEKKKSEIIVENQQLASLRDFLLPMLMNGQVKVGA